MPAPDIFPQQSYATPALAYSGLLRRLIEVDQNFKIVEAYDADNPTDKLRTPTPGSEQDLDNAAFSADSDFGFQLDSPGNGDWIVIESIDTPAVQIYWEYDSATEWKFVIIPNSDFVTGGADVSPPVFPLTAFGTSMGVSPGVVGFTMKNAVMNYDMWSGERCLIIVVRNGTAADTEFIYAGAAETDDPTDTKPFVINDRPDVAYAGNTGSRWNRLGVDGTTFLSGGGDVYPYALSTNLMITSGYSSRGTPAPAKYSAFPASIFLHRQFSPALSRAQMDVLPRRRSRGFRNNQFSGHHLLCQCGLPGKMGAQMGWGNGRLGGLKWLICRGTRFHWTRSRSGARGIIMGSVTS